MEKKKYTGLDVELIPFSGDVLTYGPVPDSGCKLGAVTYYTEDAGGNKMPWGQCWYDGDPDDLSFDFDGKNGSFVW